MNASKYRDVGRIGAGAVPVVGDVLARGFGRYRVQGVRMAGGVLEVRAGGRWIELAPDVAVWRCLCGCAGGLHRAPVNVQGGAR